MPFIRISSPNNPFFLLCMESKALEIFTNHSFAEDFFARKKDKMPMCSPRSNILGWLIISVF